MADGTNLINGVVDGVVTGNKDKMLVNVAILEASSNKQLVTSIVKALTGIENAAFKVAVRCAYLLGYDIPCGDTVIHIAKTRKIKNVSELAKLIGKSRPTISRWVKAVNYIIENGLFNDFNNGVYPFSFDKIIIIFDNELFDADFKENTIDALMAKTVVELENMVKDLDDLDDSDSDSDDDDSDSDDSDDSDDDSPLVTFSFNGQEFQCHENTLLAFIENECVIAE